MPNRFPRDIERLLQLALAAWKTIDPAMKVGALSLADLEATIEQSEQVRAEIRSLETRLVVLRNQRDAIHVNGWDQIKRLRAWVKGVYGDDSSQYEMAGGTRLSERKPYKPRKPKEM